MPHPPGHSPELLSYFPRMSSHAAPVLPIRARTGLSLESVSNPLRLSRLALSFEAEDRWRGRARPPGSGGPSPSTATVYGLEGGGTRAGKIGRASCRERV